MSRLTLLHINIIGVVVAIIVAVGMYFVLITPARDEIEKAKVERQGVLDRAAKLAGNKAERDRAIEAKRVAESTYRVYEGQYMPIIGYKKTRMATMIQTFWPNGGRSWPERFIKTFRRHMNREAKLNKVVWMNPGVLQLGPYGPDPNQINAGMSQGDGLGENGALHYAFVMQVRAPSLAALMRHIRDWNTVQGMGVPVVQGLSISGNSPNLVANYTVALTIIVHEPFPPVDNRVSGTGGGSAGGGGGSRGGPMGMGGGPTGPSGLTAPMGMGMSGPPSGMMCPMPGMMGPGTGGPPAGKSQMMTPMGAPGGGGGGAAAQ